MPIGSASNTPAICHAIIAVRNSNFFLGLSAITVCILMFLLPFLYTVIGRKFDALLAQNKALYESTKYLRDIAGIPGVNQIMRSAIYTSLIIHNYAARYKMMEERKRNGQRLGLWNAFWYKGYRDWYNTFKGFDLRAHTTPQEMLFVRVFSIIGAIIIICSFIFVINNWLAQQYCGMPSL